MPDDEFMTDLINHLHWKGDTPFVSASLSLAWAIREAKRRVEQGKKDVRIAVIDGRGQKGEITLKLLDDYASHSTAVKKARNFANASQEVLIFAYIPAVSIISIVAREDIVLPRWFKHAAQTSFRSFYDRSIIETVTKSDGDFTESMRLASSLFQTDRGAETKACVCKNFTMNLPHIYIYISNNNDLIAGIRHESLDSESSPQTRP
jgi:hypothetical protein